MPRKSTPRTVRATNAKKRPATARSTPVPSTKHLSFLQGLAVVAIVLAAGLVSLWVSQGDLARFGKSVVIGGDDYTCDLSGTYAGGFAVTNHSTRPDGTNNDGEHVYVDTFYVMSQGSAWGEVHEGFGRGGEAIPVPKAELDALGVGSYTLGAWIRRIDTFPSSTGYANLVRCSGDTGFTIVGSTNPLIVTLSDTNPLHMRSEDQVALAVNATGGVAPYAYSWTSTPNGCGGSGQTSATISFTPTVDTLCTYEVQVTDTSSPVQVVTRSTSHFIEPWLNGIQPDDGSYTINDISGHLVPIHDNGTINQVKGFIGTTFVAQGFREASSTEISVHFNFAQNGITTAGVKTITFRGYNAQGGEIAQSASGSYNVIPQTEGPAAYTTDVSGGCTINNLNPQVVSTAADMQYPSFTVTEQCDGACPTHSGVRAQASLVVDGQSTVQAWLGEKAMSPAASNDADGPNTFTLSGLTLDNAGLQKVLSTPDTNFTIRYNAYGTNADGTIDPAQWMKQHSCTVVRRISPSLTTVVPSTNTCPVTITATLKDTAGATITGNATTGVVKVGTSIVAGAESDVIPQTSISGLTYTPASKTMNLRDDGTVVYTVASSIAQRVKFFIFTNVAGVEGRMFSAPVVSFPSFCGSFAQGKSTIAINTGVCSANVRTVTVTATVRDDTNALVPNYAVKLESTPSAGVTITPATATTNASGVATFTMAAAPGTYVLTLKSADGATTVKTQSVTLATCTTACVPNGTCSATCGGGVDNCGNACNTQACPPTTCTVAETPVISVFTVNSASTATVATGATVTFGWTAANVKSLAIDQSVGAVTPLTTGTKTFVVTNATSAPVTKTYTMSGVKADGITATCTNPAPKTVTVTVNPAPPGQVQGLVCPPATITTNSFIANWTALAGATGYSYETRQNTTVTKPAADTTALTQTVTGLASNTTYTFGLRARNAGGLGPEATVTCVTNATLNPRHTLTANPVSQNVNEPVPARLTAQLFDYPEKAGKPAGDFSGYPITISKRPEATATLLGLVDCASAAGTLPTSTTLSGLTNTSGRICAAVRAPSAQNTSIFESVETELRPTQRSNATITYTGTNPSDLRLTMLIPLEGRTTFGITSLSIEVSAFATPDTILFGAKNITTADLGLYETDIPGATSVDGQKFIVRMKTAQHATRTVIGTSQNGVVSVNLANPPTFSEKTDNKQKGKYFLVAGDIAGSAANVDATMHDNQIDAGDIGAWITAFRKQLAGQTDATSILADLDKSGRIGAEDLSLIIRNFGGVGDVGIPTVTTP